MGLYIPLDLEAEVFIVLEVDGDPDGDFLLAGHIFH
jgi:hypothetical protein